MALSVNKGSGKLHQHPRSETSTFLPFLSNTILVQTQEHGLKRILLQLSKMNLSTDTAVLYISRNSEVVRYNDPVKLMTLRSLRLLKIDSIVSSVQCG